MQQVLDIISLLDQAGSERDGPRVIWRLHSASTNSPLRIRAEGTSSDPSMPVEARAFLAKQTLSTTFSTIVRERRRPDWMDTSAFRTMKRIVDRNLNGIGQTEIDPEGGLDPIQLLPPQARAASYAIETALLEAQHIEHDHTHTEYGAAEGTVLAASTYYRHPALFLKERLTGDRVTCVLSDEAARKVGIKESLSVVWQGQRILAHGSIYYGVDGRIVKIDADDIETIMEELVDLNEIRSLNMTDGLSPNEYLDRIRDEDFGED